MDQTQLSTNVPEAKIQIKDAPRSEISRKRSLLPRPSALRTKSQISIQTVTNYRSSQETIITDHLDNPSEPPPDQIKLQNLQINLKPDPVCVELRSTSCLSRCMADTVHPNARCDLPTRKKSKSSLDVQLHKKSAEQSLKSVSGSSTSRSLTTMSTMPNSLILKAVSNGIHKPGTIPPYLLPAKATFFQTQLIKRQKAFDDQKKLFSEMQKMLNKKYDDLVIYRVKVKNSVAKEMVLDKMELDTKGVKMPGNVDTNTNIVTEYDHLQRAYSNLLRFETNLQKMSDSNREASHTILDIRLTDNIKYVNSAALKTFQSISNNLLQKLTENIAEMKLEQEMALINCQSDLLLAKFKGGLKPDHKFACNNVHEILELRYNKEEPKTKILATEHQNEILKILNTETEKNLDMSQKEVILLREQLSESIKLADKYKRLEIQHEKNELKATAMEIQIRDANLMANRITNDLEASNKQLAASTQQCQILKEHVANLSKKNTEYMAFIECNRNSPVVRNQPEDLEINAEKISSVPSSAEIDKHRCIIIQLKEEILKLVQKRHGHLDIINKTQHQQIVKSLELNLVKYDRRLQHSYDVIHKLKHMLRQESKYQNDWQAEIAKLKWMDGEKQRELDSLRAQLLQADERIIDIITGYCITEMK